MRFSIPKGKKLSLSTYLVLIVAFALIPILVFCGVLAKRLIQEKHEESLRFLTKSADEFAFAFDQEVDSAIRTLQAVMMSKSLRDGDLKGFHEVLGRVLSTQPSWGNILLHDAKFNWVLSAKRPFADKLGVPPELSSLEEVVSTKTALVGKVVFLPKGVETQSQYGYAFAIRVPFLDDSGKVKYILSAILPVDVVQKLSLKFSPAPHELTRTILDRFGVIAGRSKDPEKFIGGKVSETLQKVLQSSESGLSETQSLEKIKVITAYKKAPRSGWTVAIGVPSQHLEQQAKAVTLTLVLLALILLLVSSVITVFLSRWLKKSLGSATVGAAQLAVGVEPTIIETKILEVETLRDSIIRAAKLLKNREKAKSDFLANMSHELRTPLGIVLGTADLLSDNSVEPEERNRAWETLKRNGEQLRRLIDDILDLSKVEANKLSVESIKFSISDLVSSIIEDFTLLADSKGVRVLLSIPDQLSDVISSDPVRIRQIVSNLVSNAIKFTEAGQILVQVTQEGGDKTKILVSDTGIGLSDTQKSALFLDFTQGDSSHTRKYGGTGLGLALSRKLARLLSGDVRLVSSEPGKGSIFEFTFVAPATGPLSEVASKKLKNLKESRLEGKKILLAEDSPDNVILMRAYLKNSGAIIEVANNGSDAYELTKQKEFDLILMDIQMPKMDGYEATALIRKTNSKVPIIALTAHALREHRDKAMASGFNGYLTKPIKRDNLIEAIASLGV